MNPRHKVSRAAIELIKRFEGYRRKAAQLPDGRWTLGYGHTQTARAGAEVSEQDAEALLLWDLIGIAHVINEHTYAPLNRNQFDALCSFTFNIGADNYRNSAVLRRLNEGQALQAAACMEMWRKADVGGERIVVDALVRRRAAEKLLFLTPIEGWMPAPTPLLPPQLDLDAVEALALETPKTVTLLMEGDQAGVSHGSALAPGATASERAAAAVGERLRQILPQPESVAGPSLRLTPATPYDFELEPEPEIEVAATQDGPTLFDTVGVTLPHANSAAPRVILADVTGSAHAKREWMMPFAPLALAAGGVALAGGSLGWAFYSDGGAGLNPAAVSWVGGLGGVSMMTFAAYLVLRRLGDSDDQNGF